MHVHSIRLTSDLLTEPFYSTRVQVQSPRMDLVRLTGGYVMGYGTRYI